MPKTERNRCTPPPAPSRGVYLYCFAHPASVGRIAVPGVDDDTEVAVLTAAEVAAVFSAVPLEIFNAPPGSAHLHDLSWIAPRARRHERVIETVMQRSPVLPARFGTVLASVAALERLMVRNAGAIREFLGRMADREEWSVKAFVDAPKTEAWLATAETLPAAIPGGGPLSPGLRYMHSRRLHLHARQRFEDWCRQTAADVGQSLAADAVDLCPLRLQSGETTRAEPTSILHCALLVLKNRVAAWRQRAAGIEAQYADRGLSLTVCGPWPPYSFCPPVLDAGPGE